MIDWLWILDNKIMIGELLWQHVQLVIVSLFFGTLFTGVLISLTLRWPAAAQPLIYLCGILFTIPSLALFILLLPFTGLSLMTSIIGLTLYSLLILLRNVIAGIEKLPATVLESARALGYTRWQTIWHVVLKSAMPSLMTAVILGMTRAFGETLAVRMVIGGIEAMPTSLLSPASTITTTLTTSLAGYAEGPAQGDGLWALGPLLMGMRLIFILVIPPLGPSLLHILRCPPIKRCGF